MGLCGEEIVWGANKKNTKRMTTREELRVFAN